jgi:hypothetical protein
MLRFPISLENPFQAVFLSYIGVKEKRKLGKGVPCDETDKCWKDYLKKGPIQWKKTAKNSIEPPAAVWLPA